MSEKLPRGEFANKDTGWTIRTSRVTMDETMSHAGKDGMSTRFFANAGQLLENAILLDTEITEMRGHKKGANSAFMHRFYLPIQINEEFGIARLCVDEYYENGDTKKRAYHLRTLEIKNAPQDTVGPENETSSPVIPRIVSRDTLSDNANGVHPEEGSLTEALPDTITLSGLFVVVKRFDKEFQPKAVNPAMLNPDGTANRKSAKPSRCSRKDHRDNARRVAKITVDKMYERVGKTIQRFHNLRDIKISPEFGNSFNNDLTLRSTVWPKSDDVFSISDLFVVVKRFDKEFQPKAVYPAMLNPDGTQIAIHCWKRF